MKEQNWRGKYSISVGPVKVEKPHQKCRGRDKEIKRARGEFTDLGSGGQGSVWRELSSLRQSHSREETWRKGSIPSVGVRMPNTSQGCLRAKSRFCCCLNVFATNYGRKHSVMLGDGTFEGFLGCAAPVHVHRRITE